MHIIKITPINVILKSLKNGPVTNNKGIRQNKNN